MDNRKMPSLAVLGGDRRQQILIGLLKDGGYTVTGEPTFRNEIVIGPVPCSKDGVTIHQLQEWNRFGIRELFDKMKENNCRLFVAGAVSGDIRGQAAERGIKTVDLMELDQVAVENAVPTAEGVIQAAMENSDITLFGSRCLVLGYGRCGKVLARMLKGIGAEVSVEARKRADYAYIKCFGYGLVELSGLDGRIGDFDFIFNTVPAMMLDGNLLGRVKRDCVILDIFSSGGVDYRKAEEFGIKALLMPSLPGRAAPKTAAVILRDAIEGIIRGEMNGHGF